MTWILRSARWRLSEMLIEKRRRPLYRGATQGSLQLYCRCKTLMSVWLLLSAQMYLAVGSTKIPLSFQNLMPRGWLPYISSWRRSLGPMVAFLLPHQFWMVSRLMSLCFPNWLMATLMRRKEWSRALCRYRKCRAGQRLDR